LTYAWNTGATTSTVNNLPAGIYIVTVSDANICTMSATVTVNNVVGPSITSISSTDVNCNGGSDGTITITATGTLPLQFIWSNGATTQNLSGVPAGTYTVTV